jgi:DnaJ homolog subfamily C member 9
MGHDDGDCLRQLFPGKEEIDLYKVIGIDNHASQEEIRRAYRRQALLHHPDKHVHGSEKDRVQASLNFQQISFAYAVLGEENRRKRYDSTGSTEECLPLEGGAECWDAYFKELFDKVTIARLDEDKKKYKGM